MHEPVRFCGYCGGSIIRRECDDIVVCTACGKTLLGYNRGPALLVLALIFAEGRVLLMKRGIEPYRAQWAPPGGFVEAGESLEAAVIREVWEEVRIALDSTQLLPHATVSVPNMNQVYCAFTVRLNELVSPSAAPPESIDVRWFAEEEIAEIDLWEPAASFDTSVLFRAGRTGRFEFYQQSDNFSRLITERGQIEYLWRRS